MVLMRRVLVLVLLVAWFSAIAAAQDAAPAEKNFIWRVSKGSTDVYVVGSIHALKEDAYPLPQAFERTFEEAEVLVFEIDLGEMTATAVQLMSAGSLAPGTTLEQVVGAQTWKELEAHAEESGFNPSVFSGMKPWMAALTLTAFELSKHGYLSSSGLDTYFMQRADQAGKETRALETAEAQVSLFADLTQEQSRAFLRYTLRDLELMIPEMEELYIRWRAGDVEYVEHMMLEGFEEFPDVFTRMVGDRNRAWVPQIEELLAGDRDAMVVVGSAHLVGDEGVIELLRKKGYAIERL
ncbi:MAG: TraB/GumN family protein [Acidobacteria bacterium]|nr:TraB/GumN family protein [Acidobacteriota bacterium]